MSGVHFSCSLSVISGAPSRASLDTFDVLYLTSFHVIASLSVVTSEVFGVSYSWFSVLCVCRVSCVVQVPQNKRPYKGVPWIYPNISRCYIRKEGYAWNLEVMKKEKRKKEKKKDKKELHSIHRVIITSWGIHLLHVHLAINLVWKPPCWHSVWFDNINMMRSPYILHYLKFHKSVSRICVRRIKIGMGISVHWERDREVILKIKETHVLGYTIYKGSDLPPRHTRPALVLLAAVLEAINRADHGFK